ncbi:MAG: Ig-like domain-containing protein [Bacteroidia bacterium]|nr:Ig-like domain-containing protein [Bacteroidia bacterium]
MNVDSVLLRRVLAPILFLLAVLIIACDDAVTPDEPPRISITQPADSALVTDSVVRITTEVMVKCGCNSHVEFRIDGEHVYSDYFPFFSFDWNTLGYEKGWHSIATRLVVRDVGEAWDSIAVFVSRGDSLREASSDHL